MYEIKRWRFQSLLRDFWSSLPGLGEVINWAAEGIHNSFGKIGAKKTCTWRMRMRPDSFPQETCFSTFKKNR